MLQDIKNLYGKQLGALDGTIGHVKDLYFDDKTWAVRYLVADTAPWLPGRKVLLPQHAFGPMAFGENDEDPRVLYLNLTRRQIEDSPSIESHRPVYRQYEEDYYHYYGWPAYWPVGGMRSAAGDPDVAASPGPSKGEQVSGPKDDSHLYSTRATTGYQVQAPDGALGVLRGFVMNVTDWTICELIVETGHWYAGRKLLLVPRNIVGISYEDSTVFTNLPTTDLRQTLARPAPPVEAAPR